MIKNISECRFRMVACWGPPGERATIKVVSDYECSFYQLKARNKSQFYECCTFLWGCTGCRKKVILCKRQITESAFCIRAVLSGFLLFTISEFRTLQNTYSEQGRTGRSLLILLVRIYHKLHSSFFRPCGSYCSIHMRRGRAFPTKLHVRPTNTDQPVRPRALIRVFARAL